MKKIILMSALIALCTPAFAENNTIDKRVNSSSAQDRYALPEYDVSNNGKFVRKFNEKSKKIKNNTPALTIVNEPYMPTSQTNLMHMGQAKEGITQPQSLLAANDVETDTPKTDMPPVLMKTDIVTRMPTPEPVQSYAPDTLVTDSSPPTYVEPIQLVPEPLPVQEVASLDAAEPMSLEPIMHQESLPQRARFYALAGTSLKESLRAWSGTQEFSLVWDSKRDFTVKQTVSSNSDAEMALRDILSMYEGDAVRPIGKLYRDPRTSRPVLVVKSDK